MHREQSESFGVRLGQGCAMLLWLINFYMASCRRLLKDQVVELGPRMKMRSREQSLVAEYGLWMNLTGSVNGEKLK